MQRRRFTTSIKKDYYLIRVLFFIPTLAVITLAIAVVFAASGAITHSTQNFADTVRLHTMEDIVKSARHYMGRAQNANEVSYSKYIEGKLNLSFSVATRTLNLSLQNAQVIRNHFYNYLTDLHASSRLGPHNVYIASKEGGLIILYEHYSDTMYRTQERLSSSDVFTTYEVPLGNNVRGRVVSQDPSYDPRVRPWWNVVLRSPPGGQQWSLVYTFQTGTLGITTVQKLGTSSAYDDWTGNLAVDYQLTDIDGILADQKPTERSQVILYERTGHVLSTSYRAKLRVPDSGRFTFLDITVPEFRKLGDLLNHMSEGYFGRFFDVPRQHVNTDLMKDGELWDIEIAVVDDNSGLEWLLVLMIPENDVIGVVKSETQRLAVTAALIACVVSIVSIITAQILLHPLEGLKSTLERELLDINQRQEELKKQN
eukprot:PhF_6_TR7073/c0_g1_i2/m.10702